MSCRGGVFDQTVGKFAPPRRGARGRGVSHHRRSFGLTSSCWLNLIFCGERAQRLTQIGDRLTACFVYLESRKIDTPGFVIDPAEPWTLIGHAKRNAARPRHLDTYQGRPVV